MTVCQCHKEIEDQVPVCVPSSDPELDAFELKRLRVALIVGSAPTLNWAAVFQRQSGMHGHAAKRDLVTGLPRVNARALLIVFRVQAHEKAVGRSSVHADGSLLEWKELHFTGELLVRKRFPEDNPREKMQRLRATQTTFDVQKCSVAVESYRRWWRAVH